MALTSPAYYGGTHFFLFVATISFIGTLIWIFVYLLGIREALKLPIDWVLSVSKNLRFDFVNVIIFFITIPYYLTTIFQELINTGICTVLYCIAFIVQIAVWAGANHSNKGANIAGGVSRKK